MQLGRRKKEAVHARVDARGSPLGTLENANSPKSRIDRETINHTEMRDLVKGSLSPFYNSIALQVCFR